MLTRRKFFKLTAAGVLSGCIAEPRKAEAKTPAGLNVEIQRAADRLYKKMRAQTQPLLCVGGPLDGEWATVQSLDGRDPARVPLFASDGSRYLHTQIEYRPLGGPRYWHHCLVWDCLDLRDAAVHILCVKHPDWNDRALDYVRISQPRLPA